MGGVIVSDRIRSVFDERADHAIEFFHGHTYSAHPLACAAGLATLAIHRSDDLNAHARRLERVLEDAVDELRRAPYVIDIRNVGVAAGIEIEADPKAPGRRGYEVLRRAFEDEDMVLRVGGDTIALAPALIASDDEIIRMVEGVRRVLERL